MTHVINYTLHRDDADVDLEIDYSVTPYDPGCTWGPPEDCYPPEGGEIDDLAIFGPDGKEFTLTADELQKIETHIYETHDYFSEDYAE